MAIRIQKVTLTPGIMAGIFASPQLVLNPPAAGYARTILGISHDMVFNTLAYTGAGVIEYKTNAPEYQYFFYDQNVLPATQDITSPCYKSNTDQTPFTTTRAIYVTTDAAALTGNSTVYGFIVFQDILIEV